MTPEQFVELFDALKRIIDIEHPEAEAQIFTTFGPITITNQDRITLDKGIITFHVHPKGEPYVNIHIVPLEEIQGASILDLVGNKDQKT